MQIYLNAKELAELRGVSAQTAINWAKDGYPLDNGEKIPLPGADKSGRKWVFEKKVVNRFFENLREKRWQTFTAPHTSTKKPRKKSKSKYGTTDSRLTVSLTGEQLMKRLNLPH